MASTIFYLGLHTISFGNSILIRILWISLHPPCTYRTQVHVATIICIGKMSDIYFMCFVCVYIENGPLVYLVRWRNVIHVCLLVWNNKCFERLNVVMTYVICSSHREFTIHNFRNHDVLIGFASILCWNNYMC